jgi:hypothetical protein
METIKSGFSLRNFISGIVIVLLGSGIVVAHNAMRFPMEIKGYIIPGWSVYVLSVLLFIFGIMLIAGSGRGDRCAACGKILVRKEAVFSLRDGDKIVHAVRELDAGLIRDPRKLKEGEPRIVLVLEYCNACRRVAKIAVKKEDKKRSSELVPERVVTGSPVWKFLDEIEKLREIQQEES